MAEISHEDAFRVGDVFSMKGPSVSRDLEDKYFRVTRIDGDGTVHLSEPYRDQAMTRPYHLRKSR